MSEKGGRATDVTLRAAWAWVVAGLVLMLVLWVALAARRPSRPGPLNEVASAARPRPLGFPYLPNPGRTPGATLPVTREDVCTPGYARKVRDVPSGVKA